jgi:hypothetical protein
MWLNSELRKVANIDGVAIGCEERRAGGEAGAL